MIITRKSEREDMKFSMKFIKSANSEITTTTASASSSKKAVKAKESTSRLKDYSISFVSIQLEKVKIICCKLINNFYFF